MITDELSGMTYTMSFLSFTLNAILLMLYISCRSKKVTSYKYFILLTGIQNGVLSMAILLAVPRVISGNYIFMFTATGLMYRSPSGYIPLIIYCVVFFTSLLLVTNSFVYRYLHVCRTQTLEMYPYGRKAAILCAVNVVFIGNYLLFVYTTFWPDDRLRQEVSSVTLTPKLDFEHASFIGLSLRNGLQAVKIIVIADMVMVMTLLEVIQFICAKKINNCRNLFSLSKKTQKLHTQMLILLLIQAACPALFLHFPCLAALILLCTGTTTTPFTTFAIAALVLLFPLLNPLIMMTFMREYRYLILVKLKLKDSAATVGVSALPSAQMVRVLPCDGNQRIGKNKQSDS
ncbi:hypothetical protein Aduo_004209 [Ancylostoma duodenale]